MKIFIDFDDVLFNTKEFRKEFRKIFFKLGITNDQFENTYQIVKKRQLSHGGYQFGEHLKILSKKYGLDVEKTKKEVADFVKNKAKKYLFSDVKSFLQKCKKIQVKIYIVSFGTEDFQRIKILGVGVTPWVDKIYFGIRSKIDMIKEAVGEGTVTDGDYFIDDRIKFIQEVKKEFPEIKTILVKRSEGRYNDDIPEKCCDHIAKNLKKIENIISNEQNQE